MKISISSQSRATLIPNKAVWKNVIVPLIVATAPITDGLAKNDMTKNAYRAFGVANKCWRTNILQPSNVKKWKTNRIGRDLKGLKRELLETAKPIYEWYMIGISKEKSKDHHKKLEFASLELEN